MAKVNLGRIIFCLFFVPNNPRAIVASLHKIGWVLGVVTETVSA